MPQLPEIAEFWTLQQSQHAVRCVAARHPMGVELRYLMNDHPLISRVFADWRAVEGQAREWHDDLVSRGWSALRINLPLHSH